MNGQPQTSDDSEATSPGHGIGRLNEKMNCEIQERRFTNLDGSDRIRTIADGLATILDSQKGGVASGSPMAHTRHNYARPQCRILGIGILRQLFVPRVPQNRATSIEKD